ncbi:hypothetical protein [Sphingomonas lacusdianchii]|uniref:hypothetical protein n=1 Tax=Sphingomonas lacusdianchii TaxID=2917992 RepID=UPI001F560B00|nr:hypothetical protein [Sphingomonas sp. JXJ CY 53]
MTGRDGSCLEFFHACRTGTIAEAIARLGARVGAGMAAAANVRPGVDVRDPIVVALLGTVLAARLAEDGDLGGSALLHSGDLHIVQRRG